MTMVFIIATTIVVIPEKFFSVFGQTTYQKNATEFSLSEPEACSLNCNLVTDICESNLLGTCKHIGHIWSKYLQCNVIIFISF